MSRLYMRTYRQQLLIRDGKLSFLCHVSLLERNHSPLPKDTKDIRKLGHEPIKEKANDVRVGFLMSP
jgi:hypothetical protein